jgi:small Trp-rich protein
MWFIVVGVLLVLMKWTAFGPVATWSWWIVVLPFVGGLLWFEIIEPMFGLDKRRAHNELDKVKQERIQKQLKK